MRTMNWTGLAALGLLLCQPWAAAEDKPKEKEKPKAPNELTLTTERVIVFKDGYCLVIKRALAKTDDQNEVFTEAVPDAAVLGSFWAVPKDGRLLSMDAGVVTTTDKEKKTNLCLEYLGLLKVNKGKACTVEMQGAEKEKMVYSGTIREVLAKETEQPAPMEPRPELSSFSSSRAAARPPRSPDKVTVTTLTGSLFVLRTDAGDVTLPVAQIRSLTIKDMALEADQTETATKTAKRLTFRFEKGGDREMLLMYFTPGLRWIPTYRADLAAEEEKKKEAHLTLQAELLNEVEDLDGVPVDIVVGVPNFRFKGTISPFSLESTLRNALATAAPQLMGQFDNSGFSNALVSQRGSEWRREGEPAAPPEGGVVSLPAELTAGGSQDLFVYHLAKLKLAKGHRAAVPIFEADVPYRDVYTWDLRLVRHEGAVGASSSSSASAKPTLASPLVLSQNQVWHQVELTNTTRVPWTTGAVMLTQGQQPLAQELLTYTSAGDAARVPVTVSVDTRGSLTEKETSRKLKALNWNGYDYVRVDKEAALRLTNHKKIPVELEITCQLGGAVDEASQEGKISLSTHLADDWPGFRGDPAVNNHSTVVWRTTVKPGENFSPTLQFHYFTRQY